MSDLHYDLGPDYPSSAHADRSRAHEAADVLRMDIDRLLMITEALWSILKEQHGYEDNELIKRIVQIDMRDGKLDGRLPVSPPTPCPNCGRILGKNRPICSYCGEPVALDPFRR